MSLIEDSRSRIGWGRTSRHVVAISFFVGLMFVLCGVSASCQMPSRHLPPDQGETGWPNPQPNPSDNGAVHGENSPADDRGDGDSEIPLIAGHPNAAALPPPPAFSVINCFGGQHRLGLDCEHWTRAGSCREGIGNGVRGDWRGRNAVRWLIGELRSRYNDGHRWIMLNRPMGGHPGHNVQGAAWDTIPLYKRQLMREQLKPWLERHSDLVLGVFIGTQWCALDSLQTQGNLYGFDPAIEREREAWHAVVDPWYELGVRWIVLDAASNAHKRPWVKRLIEYEDSLGRGIKITGEAIPSGPDGLWGSWLAMQRFVERHSHTREQVPPGAEWFVQPSRSDWATSISDDEHNDAEWTAYLMSLMDRGYIVASSHPAVLERAYGRRTGQGR
jgi:hypothetical protein